MNANEKLFVVNALTKVAGRGDQIAKLFTRVPSVANEVMHAPSVLGSKFRTADINALTAHFQRQPGIAGLRSMASPNFKMPWRSWEGGSSVGAMYGNDLNRVMQVIRNSRFPVRDTAYEKYLAAKYPDQKVTTTFIPHPRNAYTDNYSSDVLRHVTNVINAFRQRPSEWTL